MKEIILTGGEIALVDDEDYDRVSSLKWHLHSEGYAAHSASNHRNVLMHRFILGLTEEDKIWKADTHHLNGNKLDNRRGNIRVCNRIRNSQSKRMMFNNTSGF